MIEISLILKKLRYMQKFPPRFLKCSNEQQNHNQPNDIVILVFILILILLGIAYNVYTFKTDQPPPKTTYIF